MTDPTIRQEQVSAAARAFACLMRAAGHVEPVTELERGLEQALSRQGDAPVAPLHWLVLAAKDQGLDPLEVEADLADALERLRFGVPLLAALPRARGSSGVDAVRWVVLLQHLDNAVEFAVDGEEAPRRLPLAELEHELGLSSGERVHWLVLDAALPSEPAESPSSVVEHLPPLVRLARLLRPDRGELMAVVVFAVAIGVLLLATPVAVQALVNFVALGGSIPPLIVVAVLLFAGLSFAGVLSALQTWVVEILQRRVFLRVVADLAARLPRVTAETHDKHNVPELVNRFLDVVAIQKAGSALLLDGVSLLLSVTVGLVVLAFYHPLLLAFDILLLAAIALIVLGPLRRGVRTSVEESEVKYAVVAWLEEIARTPHAFKSSGIQSWVFDASDRLTRKYIERRKAHFRVVLGQVLGAIGLQIIASTVLLGIGGLLVIRGSLTLGQLVAAELIVTLVVSSVAKLGKHLGDFYDLVAATEKVGHLLDLPVEPRGGEHHEPSAGSSGAALALSGVRWSLAGAPPLLRSLDLELDSGGRLGVCGPSGVGKSQLLEMLWRLRRPDSGVVRLDGRDVRELSIESLRRMAALIERVEVVEGSVRHNVRLARPFVTEEQVREALRRVGLLSELERYPDGLDTRLNANGRPLSAGQLQRLQAARAIAGRPRLLLVSDVFLQLSAPVRALVLDVLFDPRAPWTLVIASNELDVLQRCQRVLVLPEGLVHDGAAILSEQCA